MGFWDTLRKWSYNANTAMDEKLAQKGFQTKDWQVEHHIVKEEKPEDKQAEELPNPLEDLKKMAEPIEEPKVEETKDANVQTPENVSSTAELPPVITQVSETPEPKWKYKKIPKELQKKRGWKKGMKLKKSPKTERIMELKNEIAELKRTVNLKPKEVQNERPNWTDDEPTGADETN